MCTQDISGEGRQDDPIDQTAEGTANHARVPVIEHRMSRKTFGGAAVRSDPLSVGGHRQVTHTAR
jgi:hypothetical protein